MHVTTVASAGRKPSLHAARRPFLYFAYFSCPLLTVSDPVQLSLDDKRHTSYRLHWIGLEDAGCCGLV